MPGPSEDGLPDGPPSSAACPEPVATPHPKRTVACEVACEEGSEVAWADAAALSLQENGFVVLRASTAEPLIDAATCEECRRIAAAQLARLFALLRGRGVDPRRDRFTFGEVCARTAGGRRPDMRLPTEGSEAEAWSPLLRAVDRWVRPVLERSQLAEDGPSGVRVDGAGCVTALPGAPPWQWPASWANTLTIGAEMGGDFAARLGRAASVRGDALDVAGKLGGDGATALKAVLLLADALQSL